MVFAHLVPWARFIQGPGAVPGPLVWVMGKLLEVFQPGDETHPAVVGFIVLSGYCIHRNGFRRSGGSLVSYAMRRCFRIYPVYTLAVAAGVAGFFAVDFLNPAPGHALAGADHVGAGCLAAKLLGLGAFVPMLNPCAYQGNPPLATVGVELWLYALYPAIVALVLRRRPERDLWFILLVCWAAGIILITVVPELRDWWHNGSLLGFLLYWWIGARFVDQEFAGRVWKWSPVILATWLALTVVVLFVAAPPFAIEPRKVLLAVLFGGLVARWDQLPATLFRRATFFGRAGYSLYAFHAPSLYVLLIVGVPWWGAGAAALLIGVMAFELFESPCQRLGRRLIRRSADQLPSLVPERP